MPDYFIRRANLLSRLLKEQGWNKADSSESADFTFDPTSAGGRVRRIDSRLVSRYTNKQMFNTIMVRHGITANLPKTYVNLKDVPVETRLYFLKSSNGQKSKEVFPCQGYEELQRAVAKLQTDKYVIQHAVENLDTRDGHKYSCRVYILVDNYQRVFMFHRVFAVLSKGCYNSRSSSRSVQLPDLTSTHRIEILDKQVHAQLRPLVGKVGAAYLREVPFSGASYHLYGLDVLVDHKKKPWLLEINSQPDVWSDTSNVRDKILEELCADLYTLVIAPRVLGVPEHSGKFIQYFP